jgi:trigger factor
MQSKLKKLEGTRKQLEVKIPAERVNSALAEVLEDIRKEATVDGFRKGKAPVDIIYKTYKDNAVDEVKNRLIPEACQSAMEEHDVTPVSYPEISDIVLDPAGVLAFTARVDTQPEFKLSKYDGIKVAGEKIKVDESEVSDTIKRICNMYAEFADIPGPVRKGDFAVCDVEAFADGKVISNKRENMWIEANKESSLLGMGEELCGLNKGDSKSIHADLPAEYPDKKYAGKKAEFKILVKDIKEKKLPELSDDLARKLGKEDAASLKEDINKELSQAKENALNGKLKGQIIEHLVKKHNFDLPGSMVKRQLDVLVERAKQDLIEKGVDERTIDSERDKLQERLAASASDKVKLYFILDAIAREEEIAVTDEDVDNWIKRTSDHYRQPFDEVKAYYVENDLMGGVKEEIKEAKTLDLILEKAHKEMK